MLDVADEIGNSNAGEVLRCRFFLRFLATFLTDGALLSSFTATAAIIEDDRIWTRSNARVPLSKDLRLDLSIESSPLPGYAPPAPFGERSYRIPINEDQIHCELMWEEDIH